jgi:hypothetical protein
VILRKEFFTDTHHGSPALFSLSILRQFAPFLARVGSPAFRRMLVEWTPIPLVRKVMHMSDVMYNTVKEILEEKSQSTVEPQATQSRDIISALSAQTPYFVPRRICSPIIYSSACQR